MSISTVPEISKNGKHTPPPALFEIQLNRKIQFDGVVQRPIKTRLKRLSNNHNKITDWETVIIDVPTLANLLRQGYTVRPAIKIDGNDDKYVTRFACAMVDFDESSIESTMMVPESTYAALWYRTPSYVEGENDKHRLVFIYDISRSPEDASRIREILLSKYPYADRLMSLNSIAYGSTASGVTVIDENMRLPTDAILSMSVDELSLDFGQGALLEVEHHDIPTPPPPVSETIIKAGCGVRGQALRWINKTIWNGKCGGDINKLYALHTHNLTEQRNKKNLGSWHGHRPEDTEKPKGSGFYVHWKNPEYPPMFTNPSNTTLDKSNTFIEYWHYYSNYFGKNWGSIIWKDDQKNKNFQIVCDDIARHFDVPPFDFDAVKEKKKQETSDILKQVEQVLQTYVYMLKAGAKDSYLYWDFSAGVWRVKPDATQVFRDCIKYSMKNHHEVDSDILDNPKIALLIESHIKRYDGYKSFNDKIDFDVKRCADVVPLANGDWNWRTKIFTESFDHTNYNMTRSPLDFTATTPALTPGVSLLMRWINDVGYSENQRRGVLSWLIVNCLGIATRTKRMLNVFGTPETGKTVIGQVIQNCLGSLGMTLNGNSFTDAGNRFANQSLDGAYGLFIDEFRTDARGWEMLKQLTGNADLTINVEKKGLSDYKSKFYAGITTATQDKFYIPNSDDGGIRRRVALLKHTPEMHKPHLKNIDLEFAKPGISQDIFNWCIQQDGEKAVSDFIAFAESDESKSALQETVLSSDKTLQFMADCIVFTDDEKDVVSNFDIQSYYENWLTNIAGEYVSESVRAKFVKITQYIREKVAIKDNGFIWKLCPPKGENPRVRIGGKQVRGLRGIKLIPTDSDCPI
jgi:Family of unknown function (DUF5906)